MESSTERNQPPIGSRRISDDRTHTVFAPHIRPALVASRGETIILHTQDCYHGRVTENPQTHEHIDNLSSIPLTGPIYVDGAEIGDVLSVQILDIAPAATGITVIRPRIGILGRDIRRPLVRAVSIQKDRINLTEHIALPVHPVIGNIGVAPRHGQISTGYPGRHGGNMDTQEITAGTRVLIPVQVKGALLSLGDVKASLGDGQISGGGVEVAAEVTIRIDTLPGGQFLWPRLKTSEAYITVTSASSIGQASRLAVMEMIRWLEMEKGLDFETAYSLVGLVGDLRVSQWDNPLVTCRLVFNRKIFNRMPTRHAPAGRSLIFTTPRDEDFETETDEELADEMGASADLTAEGASSRADGPENDGAPAGEEGEKEAGEEKTRSSRRSRRGRRRRSGSRDRSQASRNRGDSASGGSSDPEGGAPADSSEAQDGKRDAADTAPKTPDSEEPPDASRSRGDRQNTDGGQTESAPESSEKNGGGEEQKSEKSEQKPARRFTRRRPVRRKKPSGSGTPSEGPADNQDQDQ